MNFGKALTYPLDDQEVFTKVGIGSIVALVPIANLSINGYMAQIIRNVANGDPRPLPRWDDFGDHLVKGLYIFVAQLAYGIIPAILVSSSVFLFIIPIAAVPEEQATAGLGAGVIAASCALLLGLALSIALGLLLMAGIMRFSVGRQEMGELFEVGANWNYLRTNFSTIFLAMIYVAVIGLLVMSFTCVLSFVLGVIPICGQIIAYAIGFVLGFLLTVFSAHIYGQAARETGLGMPVAPAV